MHYKTGYCFTSEEMFDTFNTNKISIKKETCEKKYACHSKKTFCGRVLAYCLYLIILDIILNNVTFVLPVTNYEGMIHVKNFTGEQFRNMYTKGKFAGIDFFNSNFTGYQIYFRYQYKGGFKEKPIYISKKLKDIFYENINNGKQYY